MSQQPTINWRRIAWISSSIMVLFYIGISFFVDYGGDLYLYYMPFAKGCDDCGFNPYYARWFFAPLMLLPNTFIAWPIWNIVVFAILFWLIYTMDVNPLIVASFAVIGQFWLGQVDIYLCIGIYLILKHENPLINGIGLCFLAIKPQVMALAMLYLLIGQPWPVLARMLVAPIVMALLSFAVFGIDWPVRWLSNTQELPVHMWRYSALDTWRFALPFIWVPLLFKQRDLRIVLSIAVMALASPFFGIYTYIVLVLFYPKWWTIPLSYVWVLFIPLAGPTAMRFAWILPLAIIAHICYSNWPQSWWAQRQQRLAS